MVAHTQMTAHIAADEQQAGGVRRLLRAQLSDWQVADVVEDVLLGTHELFVNAAKYGSEGPSDSVDITVEHRGSDLLIGVADSSAVPPKRRDGSLLDLGGRGLPLVEAVSAEWGFDIAPDGLGKTVWFRVRLPQTEESDPIGAARELARAQAGAA